VVASECHHFSETLSFRVLSKSMDEGENCDVIFRLLRPIDEITKEKEADTSVPHGV
jgi:hypothetical protein